MELLELDGMLGVPSPALSHIQPFNEIIERDDSEHKMEAAKELAYIHLLIHWESPYATWAKDIRPKKIIKDIWGQEDAWTPDDLVIEGIEKYKDLSRSEHEKLLESARMACSKLIDHFNNLILEDPKDAKDAINNISKVGDVVEGIDKLKEQIEKHESKTSANRAGVTTNKYSEG